MDILVVGAGMIGKERIKAIEKLGENIIGIVDPAFSIKSYPYYNDISEFKDRADWIFICTPHHLTCQIADIAYNKTLNILTEKPLGRTGRECRKLIENKEQYHFRVGFNYRFFKGVCQLIDDIKNNLFGDLISVNMVLSLGDAPGSEKRWRLNRQLTGAGSMLDPGIHLIDLAMIISEGTLEPQKSLFWHGFWNTGIIEESHILASDKNNVIYNIQSSVTHWRNTFRIEVNGTEGYGIVEGRNRFYGNQTYLRGKRWAWQSGKSQRESEELVVDYDGEDSFFEETKVLLYGPSSEMVPGTLQDNLTCLEFIDSITNNGK